MSSRGVKSTLTKSTATSDTRRAEAQRARAASDPKRAITSMDLALAKKSAAGTKRGRENDGPDDAPTEGKLAKAARPAYGRVLRAAETSVNEEDIAELPVVAPPAPKAALAPAKTAQLKASTKVHAAPASAAAPKGKSVAAKVSAKSVPKTASASAVPEPIITAAPRVSKVVKAPAAKAAPPAPPAAVATAESSIDVHAGVGAGAGAGASGDVSMPMDDAPIRPNTGGGVAADFLFEEYEHLAFKDKRWETGALPAAKRLLATLKYGSRPEDMRNVALKLVIKRVALENYIKAHHEELAAAVRAQKADLANKAATDSTAVARFLEQLAAARKEVTAHRSAAERAQAELLAIKESAAELASAAAESAASKNEVGALRAQLAASASTIAALKGDCAAATHALGAAQAASAADRAALLADARAELDKLRAELADAHARETAAALAAVQSSAHASVGALAAQVTSLTAALDASRADLVNSQAAAAEAIRDAQSSFNAAMSRSEEIIREKNAEIANLDKGLEDLVKSADESAARVRELEASLVTAAAERDTWAARWAVVDSKRSRCLEELLSLKGSIRVMSRVRPPLNSEMAPQSSGAGAGAGAGGKSGSRYTVPKGGTSVGAADADPLFAFPGATADDATDIDVVEAPAAGVDGTMRDGKRTRFTLQRAFPPTASQSDVFGEVEGLVQSALDGHRVTIFAYGQTGSGKTHTMMGDATADGAGIIPRATDLIFDRVARMADQGWKTVVTVDVLEIYNDTLRDLLTTSNTKLALVSEGKSSTGGGPFVDGLSSAVARNASDVRELLTRAAAARATGATAMNTHSSRSHFIFTLHITCSHAATRQTRTGTLSLVDLAGSERLSKSQAHNPATGGGDKLLKETQAINLSLSTLGEVVSALQTKAAYVPYRRSTLTHALQDALGAENSRTLFICALNPLHANTSESLGTLQFAQRLAGVQKGAGPSRT